MEAEYVALDHDVKKLTFYKFGLLTLRCIGMECFTICGGHQSEVQLSRNHLDLLHHFELTRRNIDGDRVRCICYPPTFLREF